MTELMMSPRERQIQQGIALSDRGFTALAELHHEIKRIAFGGIPLDSEAYLVRTVFAAVDNEIHLRQAQAETPE